jgi:membrane protease YdiL (CAAX protease family)
MEEAMATTTRTTEAAKAPLTLKGLLARSGWFVLCLAVGLAIFAFGVDYHTRFWTNTSGAYKVGLSGALLLGTFALRRSERGKCYWRVALAFFAASLTNVVTWYLAPSLQAWLVGVVRVSTASPQGLALGKLVDVVLRLTPILGVMALGGESLVSLYIRKGQLHWSLGLGLLALVNLTATALAVAASTGGNLTVIFTSLPWWAVYALMNAVMEEVWFRGLFLGRLEPLIGAAGALWLTSLLFGVSHLYATYLDPGAAPVFGVIVLTLGLAFGLLMQKTKTLWGSVIYHTAADIFWFVAFGF